MTRFLVALTLALPPSTTALACPDGPEGARCGGAAVETVVEKTDYTAEWRDYLAERRAVQVQRLIEYANARVFPVNDDFYGLENIFLDEQDRPCGMANLIWLDGHEELVRRTAKRKNDLKLGDVKRGPLMEWMLTSGLTQGEAAFVQVPDMYVDYDLPEFELETLVLTEQDRLQTHFLASAEQLLAYEEASLDEAVAALGKRVRQAPPVLEDPVYALR